MDEQAWVTIAQKLRSGLPPASWERAGVWPEKGLVVPTRQGNKEEVWAVRPPGQSRAEEVTFWPQDTDWACTCDLPACMHAAAAIMARAMGVVMTGPTPELLIKYQLFRKDGELALDRKVPVGAIQKNEDKDLQKFYGPYWGKTILRSQLPTLIPMLASVQVTLDNQPITIETTPVLPIVLVEDVGPDIRVRLLRNPGIEELFRNGMVRVGTRLRPTGKLPWDENYTERLKNGLSYRADELQRLAMQDLPELRKKITVEVRSQRIPEVIDTPPRMMLEIENTGYKLKITPRMVYGDPPIARIERGAFVLTSKKLPIRRLDQETRLTQELSRFGPNLAVNLSTEREGEAALALIDTFGGWVREEVLRRAPMFKKYNDHFEPKIAIGEGRNGGFSVEIDAGGASPEALLRAWQDGASFVPLLNGGWKPVPGEWMEEHGHLLAELLSAREGNEVPRHAASLVLEALEELEQDIPPSLDGIRALAGDFTAIPEVPLPPGLRATLRPYQQQGLNWLVWLRNTGMGGILADDMGLGKTLQCLAALATAPGPHLVVAPTSVIRNWENEARKFLPEVRVGVFHGPRRQLDPTAFLTLTTYAILRLDLELLSQTRWSSLVLDEAQAIKNHSSQAAIAAFSLPAQHKLALSGTPIENRLEELWSAFRFVAPGLLGGLRSFQDRFASPIATGSREAQTQLRRRVRPFIMRRLKSEVAKDLPPRTSVVLRCTLSESERKLYNGVRTLGQAEAAKLLSSGGALSVLEVLLRMRQAACHGGLLSDSWAEGSSKIELLLENLEQVVSEGHRALVFSQWTSLLDRVEPELTGRGLGFVRLDGSTRDRGAVVSEFMREDGPPVFLLSLKAGGTGLNLTRADYVFHLDPWWNPAVEDQATDRAHRLGQDRPVVSCRLIAENTVEERIVELQERKRELVRAALDEEALAKSLSRDELLELFA